MAAADQHYRNQYTLDIVFAVSSVLMLGSMILMLVADFRRPWKTEQREFYPVQVAMAQRQAVDAIPSAEEIGRAESAVAEARKFRGDHVKEIDELNDKIAQLRPTQELNDAYYNKVNADLGSRISFFNIAVDEAGAEGTESEDAKKYKEEITQLQIELDKAQAQKDKTTSQIRDYQLQLDQYEGPVTRTVSSLNKLNDKFDAQVAISVKKQFGWDQWLRSQFLIEAYASPLKIQQFTINDIPIDYNFKYVTRFDRCMTCHQGIDRPAYTKENLLALTKITDQQEARLDDARQLLREHKATLKGLPESKGVPAPSSLQISKILRTTLTDARISEYSAHPRLDLFVGPTSKHPAEKFGCTSCHSGQGSSTSFEMASHSPNTSAQKEEWEKEHGWRSMHDWDFPMLPQRFVESSCLKCHYQVIDLISADNRVEAPKVVKGYNTIRELGCYGCHEIQGRKGGRDVGPDMRLKPSPPLEDLSPTERARAESDPDNPPGTLRKVGPSLARLGEKTNPDWALKWLMSPRSFRPDTKMPHFYGLANNSPETLPEEQKKFPETEIQAIVHFLFENSDSYLKDVKKLHDDAPAIRAKDEAYRNFLSEFLSTKASMTPDALKMLRENLPASTGISAEQLAQWEKGVLPEQSKAVTQILDIELRKVSQRIQMREVPILVDQAEGYAGVAEKGRALFSERGCLACHRHEATETAQSISGKDNYVPAMSSEAEFGPNLSQVVDKLGKKMGDKASARIWLVQWLLNPKVHSPYSRMPITHLTPQQAADVAAWILEQKASQHGPNWPEVKVAPPEMKNLTDLAEVYLVRILSKSDMKDLLSGKKVRPEAIADLPVDERELLANVDENALLHYLGKKAVGRLGCYSCHDIPGFESAKTIGVGLNDWGKKDASRLAFEDIKDYVAGHFRIADSLVKDGKPLPIPVDKNGVKKPPLYEKFYAEALFHETREGYLNQKLLEPRSYDHNRIKAWDDRARMPQFRFARPIRKVGEKDEDYEARAFVEEAEAREAVETFVLGLVAEQVPMASVSQPRGDRLAEIKGRKVLDTYNCGGCHLIRPGVFEFKVNDKVTGLLDEDWDTSKRVVGDHVFPGHYLYTGKDPEPADRLVAHGVRAQLTQDAENPSSKSAKLKISQALRFFGGDKAFKDIISESQIQLDPASMVYPPPAAWTSDEALSSFLSDKGPLGGRFADLLSIYLGKKDLGKGADAVFKINPQTGDSDNGHAAGPPVLFGQGERTQPEWLYSFLLNPQPVRTMTVLRMPKFGMSTNDARILVDYFAAVEHFHSPGAASSSPFEAVPQKQALDGAFWQAKNAEYLSRLKATKMPGADGKESTAYDQRIEQLTPTWQQISKDYLDKKKNAEEKVKAAQSRADDAKKNEDEAKAKLKDVTDKAQLATLQASAKKATDASEAEKQVLSSWQDELKLVEGDLSRNSEDNQRRTWEESDAYVDDAYKLLLKRDMCLTCHQIGTIQPAATQGVKGPPLNLASERLRAGWLERWIANPQRYVPHVSPMPVNFPSDKLQYQDYFVGTSRDQIDAVRDVLLNLPRISAQPVNQYQALPLPAANKQ